MRDFTIHLGDRPGELARVATMLARYGVNLKSVAGIHPTVNDAVAAIHD